MRFLARVNMRISPEAGGLRLAFAGTLDAAAAARAWPEAVRRARGATPLLLDLSGLEALDTAGAVLLLRLEALAREARWQAANAAVQAVLERTRHALAAPAPPAPPPQLPWLAWIGQLTVQHVGKLGDGIAFLGATVVSFLASLRHLRRLRWQEVLRHLDEAGLRAFGLTILLGVLLGLILAFQSSVPMRRFGAESFIPNLVGISLLRELGPLMAAVILSGRTGSAYAAEIGTMTVNEEVDALRIMGIDPVAWLVLPRVVAAVAVMPVLSLLMNLAGLIGMGAVMSTLGYPPASVIAALSRALTMEDLLSGLFKAAVFGLSIGMIGCRSGLGAGRGPRAVGDAATAAVVGGIVSVVLLDGIFAVLFYRLGL
jgi:phospholipid/cholesterol/gamma-HCH transport system permease protein